MLVKNIFTDRELSCLCAVWAAQEWLQMHLLPVLFNVSQGVKVVGWGELSCHFLSFVLLAIVSFFWGGWGGGERGLIYSQAGRVQPQLKAMEDTQLYCYMILLVSSFPECLRAMKGLSCHIKICVGNSRENLRKQIPWLELISLYSGFIVLINKWI